MKEVTLSKGEYVNWLKRKIFNHRLTRVEQRLDKVEELLADLTDLLKPPKRVVK